MASIILSKIIRTDPIYAQKSLLIFSNAVRNHWNYQYKPGPCPKTPEERAAAAKKYGLTVEEYQPYPESACYGDYPKMPDIGADSKDPHYPYDCPEFKRNFNEPIHATAEIFGEDRYDPSMRPRFSITFQFMCLMAALGGSWIAFTYLEDFKIGRPVIQKQYPGQGTHYLFCPK